MAPFPINYCFVDYASGPPIDSTMRGSHLARLLPYLEQQAIYDRINFNIGDVGQTLDGTASGVKIETVAVAAFRCPSDSRLAGNGLIPSSGVAFTNYVPSAGPTRESDSGSPTHPCNGTLGRRLELAWLYLAL